VGGGGVGGYEDGYGGHGGNGGHNRHRSRRGGGGTTDRNDRNDRERRRGGGQAGGMWRDRQLHQRDRPCACSWHRYASTNFHRSIFNVQ
jgi:hypothetical protein